MKKKLNFRMTSILMLIATCLFAAVFGLSMLMFGASSDKTANDAVKQQPLKTQSQRAEKALNDGKTVYVWSNQGGIRIDNTDIAALSDKTFSVAKKAEKNRELLANANNGSHTRRQGGTLSQGEGYNEAAPLAEELYTVETDSHAMWDSLVRDSIENGTAAHITLLDSLEGGKYEIPEGANMTLDMGELNSFHGEITTYGRFTLTGADEPSKMTARADVPNAKLIVAAGSTVDMTGGEISGQVHSAAEIRGTLNMSGGTMQNNRADLKGGAIEIFSGGRLNLSGTGAIRNNTSSDKGGGVFVNNDATFTMTDGTIEGNEAANGGGGVYGFGNGRFEMSGGTISENTSRFGGGMYIEGTFTMTSGTIERNRADVLGGGMFVIGNGRFEMSGGTISENTSGEGGGVYAEGTFEMRGGKIHDNMALDSFGGSVLVGDEGTFTMTGGEITNNTVNNGGSGVLVRGIVNISGGKIADNFDENIQQKQGVAIHAYNGTVNLTGGEIRGDLSGEGLYEFNISGAPKIYDENGVVQFTVTGALDENNAHIEAPWAKDFIITSGFEANSSSADYKKIFAIMDGNGSLLIDLKNGEVVAMDPWYIAVQTSLDNSEQVIYKLYYDWTATDAVFGTGVGYGITGNLTDNDGHGSLVIPNGANIILDLNGFKIDLNRGSASGRVICVNRGAELTITDTSAGGAGIITGGNMSGILNRGTLILEGGTISENTTADNDGYGAGIYNSGTLGMNGGVITGNNGCASGGGVYNIADATFTMTGGTIEGNIARYGAGIDNSGTLVMNGGVISGNSVSHCGGGVYQVGGTFTMTGGTIEGNEADIWGAGVFIDGTFTMSGGTIEGNTATNMGGGVYVNYGVTFTMTDGTIAGNTASLGGGIYLEGATFTMTDGTIEGNTADDGGGVYVNYGIFNMTGGEIRGDLSVEGSYKFNISGAPKIYDEKGEVQFTVTGALDADNAHIEAPWADGFVVTNGYDVFNSEAPSLYFTCTNVPENMVAKVLLRDGEVVIVYDLSMELEYGTGNIIFYGKPAIPNVKQCLSPGLKEWTVTDGTGSARINPVTGMLTPLKVGTVKVQLIVRQTSNFNEMACLIEVEIKKGEYDLSAVRWDYASGYTYTGNEFMITVRGLPEGVNVKYEGNVATNAGKYTAKVVEYMYDDVNYNAPVIPDCEWIIRKANPVIDISVAGGMHFFWQNINSVGINGNANTAGTFTWGKPGELLTGSDMGHTWIFTPEDTANFNTVSGTLVVDDVVYWWQLLLLVFAVLEVALAVLTLIVAITRRVAKGGVKNLQYGEVYDDTFDYGDSFDSFDYSSSDSGDDKL